MIVGFFEERWDREWGAVRENFRGIREGQRTKEQLTTVSLLISSVDC